MSQRALGYLTGSAFCRWLASYLSRFDPALYTLPTAHHHHQTRAARRKIWQAHRSIFTTSRTALTVMTNRVAHAPPISA